MPDLARLRDLILSGGRDANNSLGDPETDLLAGCPRLSRLRTLSLWNNRIGATGVRAVAASPYLARLRTLDLTQNVVGPDGLRALAHSASLPALSNLALYGNKLDDASLIDLATSPLASRLRQLNVGGSSATVAAARALAGSPALARLRSLDIDNSHIGDAGLMYLAHSPHLKCLRELYLRHTDIGDAGIAVLLRSPLALRLRVLDIEAADITGVTAWQIVRATNLDRLRKLEMWDCDNLQAPVCNALKRTFGKRVTVHADERPRRARPRPEAATRASFLADIRARPEDDAPRLIFADWLDEHGEPERAEFIRVQCELARLGEDDPRCSSLKQRELQLLDAHQLRWTEVAFLDWLRHPQAECPDPSSHKVCRVMVRAVEARLRLKATQEADEQQRLEAQLERCGAALAKLNLTDYQARLPLFEECIFKRGFPETVVTPELMLLDFTGVVRDLGVVRHLTTRIDDDAEVGDFLVGRVIACFDVPRLLTLNVEAWIGKLSTFEALAAWPGAEELTELEFGFVSHRLEGDDVLRVLAGSPYLRKLTRLRLYLCSSFTEAGVAALADSANLPALISVYLGEDENEVPEAAERILRERFPNSPGNQGQEG